MIRAANDSRGSRSYPRLRGGTRFLEAHPRFLEPGDRVRPERGMKRLALVIVSVAILGWLWHKTGWTDLWERARALDPWWFGLALLMFVPQTLVSALRWTWIVHAFQPLSLGRSTQLVLASSSLNVILPSKMGDVLKGAFLAKDRPGGDVVTGVSLGLFEKVTDTAALAAIMVAASIFQPPQTALDAILIAGGAAGVLAFALLLSRRGASLLARCSGNGRTGLLARACSLLGRIGAVILEFQKEPRRMFRVLLASLLLWTLHLAQFSFVYQAVKSTHDPLTALLWSRIPMAIFIGLVPISFAGVGTRDAALHYFLQNAIGGPAALLLGAFATFRYVVVALAGLPFVWRLPAQSFSRATDSDFNRPPPLTRRRQTPAQPAPAGPPK